MNELSVKLNTVEKQAREAHRQLILASRTENREVYRACKIRWENLHNEANVIASRMQQG